MCWLHWRVSVPLSRWDGEWVRHIICWSAILICSGCYWAPGTVPNLATAWFVACGHVEHLWVRTGILFWLHRWKKSLRLNATERILPVRDRKFPHLEYEFKGKMLSNFVAFSQKLFKSDHGGLFGVVCILICWFAACVSPPPFHLF